MISARIGLVAIDFVYLGDDRRVHPASSNTRPVSRSSPTAQMATSAEPTTPISAVVVCCEELAAEQRQDGEDRRSGVGQLQVERAKIQVMFVRTVVVFVSVIVRMSVVEQPRADEAGTTSPMMAIAIAWS